MLFCNFKQNCKRLFAILFIIFNIFKVFQGRIAFKGEKIHLQLFCMENLGIRVYDFDYEMFLFFNPETNLISNLNHVDLLFFLCAAL